MSYTFKITLPVIANEILDNIALYLSKSDRLSMIHTCWSLHDVGARLLYRDIETVSQYKARRLFKTLAESKEVYAEHVRSLKYTAVSNTDIYCTYILLCDAIPRMKFVRNLSVTVRPQISAFLVYLLHQRSIIPSLPPLFVSPKVRRHELIENSNGHLANLSRLNINGDLNLLKIVQTRSLTSLCITEMLEESEFTFFIDTMTNGTNRNFCLQELVLTVDHKMGNQIALTLWRLDFSFPNLTSLLIRTPTANALEASQIFTIKPPIFPALQKFSLNDWTILRPVYSLVEKESMELQKTHIIKAGRMRQKLEAISFGIVHWLKEPPYQNRWEKHLEPIPDDDFGEADYGSNDHPLFWDVVYKKPQAISSLDLEILS